MPCFAVSNLLHSVLLEAQLLHVLYDGVVKMVGRVLRSYQVLLQLILELLVVAV